MDDESAQQAEDVGGADDPVQEAQTGKGYGEDEGERDDSLPDESDG